MRHLAFRFLFAALCAFAASCGGDDDGAGDGDAGTDADTDTDTDTDSDTDSDSDSDTGSDTDFGTDSDTSTDADSGTDTDTDSNCLVFVNGSIPYPVGADGSTWELALPWVQAGIDAAEALIEDPLSGFSTCDVWVAAGTYLPTKDLSGETPSDCRDRTISLKEGVNLYGGFAGNETTFEERDVDANPTILSGEVGVPGEVTDNSYYVVFSDVDVTIDSFTITDGNASGYGGGMHNYASPTVVNCTFVGNWAALGGAGMFNGGSLASPLIVSCKFEGNSLSSDYSSGGGMYNDSASPTVVDCTFEGNSAVYGGGGMYNEGASPTVTNCTFEGNSAAYGGGMYNFSWVEGPTYASPVVTGCTFMDNTASVYGGGMANRNSLAMVTNSTFEGNSAVESGGGMHSENEIYLEYPYPDLSDVSPTVNNCVFSDNTSYFGGGIATYNCDPIVMGCTLTGNTAEFGGGAYNDSSSYEEEFANCSFFGNSANGGGAVANQGSSPTMTNCTFWGNTAEEYGGVMSNNFHSSPRVRNGIMWGNFAPTDVTGHNTNLSSPTVIYSDIEGGCTIASGCTTDETGNIDADPMFVNTDIDAGVIDLHLQPGSPCIDTGSTGALPNDVADLDDDGDTDEPLPYDLDGNPRVVDASVDMGAYEVQ